jgi:hypothetical protein
MLVGHSFGARVLEHAIENGVTLYDPERTKDAVPVRPRVDLVLYVNAANDARLSLGRVLSLQKNPITVRHPDYDPSRCPSTDPHDPMCQAYPLIVAITSRADQATKMLQPIANTINFDKKSAPMPTLPTGFIDPTPSAGRVKRSAPGHLPFIHSHEVTEVVCPAAETEPVKCAPDDPHCAFAFRSRGECAACFKATQRGKVGDKAPFNETAFWIMNVDARVVKDHGDIWNQSLLNMLGELMAPSGFFDPALSRVQIRAAPTR